MARAEAREARDRELRPFFMRRCSAFKRRGKSRQPRFRRLRSKCHESGRVERWRGGLGAAYLFPALSSAGASLASPYSVSTLPLIKPDVQISRIRLSDKDSCFRPRNVAVTQVESSKTQLSVDVFVGITRDRLSRLNLVLPTQPPTEPFAGMSGYNSIRFAHGTLAKVVGPANHHTVE